MPPAFLRRAGLVAGILIILGTAVGGTVLQRRSIADYATARADVTSALDRYASRLRVGQSRSDAVRELRAAGAGAPSAPSGDIVVTVLRELRESARCRSVVGQLHVSLDADARVTGWEKPVSTSCD